MKASIELPCPVLSRLIEGWRAVQVGPSSIVRWSAYGPQPGVETPSEERIRPQNLAEHKLSLERLVRVACEIFFGPCFERGIRLDIEALRTAALEHDHGEWLCGRDVQFARKGVAHDREEFDAYEDFFALRSGHAWELARSAYLLQHVPCSGDEECDERRLAELSEYFPEVAMITIRALREVSLWEARVFTALETLDYILYALEQHAIFGNKRILRDVLGRQLPRLAPWIVVIPGFDQLWTPVMQEWCAEFMLGGKEHGVRSAE